MTEPCARHLRYKRHYFMASGINAQSMAGKFLQHANEESLHADQMAQRIVQLGGKPDLSPPGLPPAAIREVLNNIDFQGKICPG